MKLSIWQQFSSNHSAAFNIIAQFKSPEEAQKRHSELTEILQDIRSTIRQDLDNWYGTVAVTSIEKHYAEKYAIDWHETIDWINFYQILEPLIVWNDLIVFDPTVSSWQTGHQIVKLLKVMGGDVYRNVMEGREPETEDNLWMFVDIRIQCILGDANKFLGLDRYLHIQNLGHLYQRFESNDYHAEMPWCVYHPRYVSLTSNMDQENYFRHQHVFLQESLAWHLSPDENKNAAAFFKQDSQFRRIVGQLRKETSFSIKEIEQDQRDQLTIKGFSSPYLSYALPAFLSWLRSLNCDVTYEFRQETS